MSASALDAISRGVPVISLKKILNQDALKRIPFGFHYDYYEYLWQAESLEQLKEFIQMASQKKLPVSPNPDYFKEYIFRHFHFPRKKPSAYLVAESIADLLKNNRPRKFQPLHNSSTVKSRFYTALNYFPFSPELAMWYWYLSDHLQGRNASGGPKVTFLHWKWKEISKASDTAKKIIASYKEGSHGT